MIQHNILGSEESDSQVNELLSLLKEVEIEKISLQHQFKKGIINKVDAVTFFSMNRKKELTLKMKLINKVHKTATGRKATIAQGKPTKSYPDGYWYTRVEGGTTLKAKTKDELILKLYHHYYGDDAKMTIAVVFEKALSEKQRTENPKQETVRRYRYEFDKYISSDFRKKDIAEVSDSDLKEYTQTLVNSQKMTKKRYLSYKGVLNLIFGYAVNSGIIANNPVAKIKNQIYLKSCDCRKPDSAEKILTPEEIQSVIASAKERADKSYYVYYYAIKFASLTGVRCGELCSLHWSDIDYENMLIHIHRQQLSVFADGHNRYYEVQYTKNEKGISEDGRLFPITDDILSLLYELKAVQDREGIKSEYVFCLPNGQWINMRGYDSVLWRLCKKHSLNVTNNHALRMSLNSNVLLRLDLTAADRAKLLGHSVQTNLSYYTFAQKGYVDSARTMLNNIKSQNINESNNYYSKEKSPETLIS